ncbi:putative glycine dehydrogenase (decarboxylating) subunit [Trichinella pseudospiralis]
MDIVLKYFTKGTLEIGASAQNDIRQYLSRPLAECFFRVGKTTISEQPITQKGWSGENGSGRDQRLAANVIWTADILSRTSKGYIVYGI